MVGITAEEHNAGQHRRFLVLNTEPVKLGGCRPVLAILQQFAGFFILHPFKLAHLSNPFVIHDIPVVLGMKRSRRPAEQQRGEEDQDCDLIETHISTLLHPD